MMTPELKTCLDYCDHGEGGGEPYLPTLHGLIVNAVSAELASKRDAQLCRAREAMQQLKGGRNDIEDLRAVNALSAALSTSAPCPHEEEAKRLREELYKAHLEDYGTGHECCCDDCKAYRRKAKEGK